METSEASHPQNPHLLATLLTRSTYSTPNLQHVNPKNGIPPLPPLHILPTSELIDLPTTFHSLFENNIVNAYTALTDRTRAAPENTDKYIRIAPAY
tara:strand:- start:751 stop:1038 length:288 start_codon:yes stop_codon:yes gene_type:complete